MADRRPIRAASAAALRRRGHHALAPAHLGEATAAATVAVVVGGVALVISGLGILAMGLTMSSRYSLDPPPNVDSLGLMPMALGAGLLALGAALTAGGLAVIGNVRRARLVTGLLSAVAAGLAALGTVAAMVLQPADVVIAVALTVATLVFGVAALLLLRPRR